MGAHDGVTFVGIQLGDVSPHVGDLLGDFLTARPTVEVAHTRHASATRSVSPRRPGSARPPPATPDGASLRCRRRQIDGPTIASLPVGAEELGDGVVRQRCHRHRPGQPLDLVWFQPIRHGRECTEHVCTPREAATSRPRWVGLRRCQMTSRSAEAAPRRGPSTAPWAFPRVVVVFSLHRPGVVELAWRVGNRRVVAERRRPP